MITRVILGAKLRDLLVAEAAAAFPRECCGLIEGVREETAVRVLAVHPTPNLAMRPDRFEIDPAAQFALLRRLRGSGREIVGCYHSHPNGAAELSACDREGAFESDFLWLVLAVAPRAGCEPTISSPLLQTNPPRPEGEAGEPASLSASCSTREPGGGNARASSDTQLSQLNSITTHSGFATTLAAFVVEGDGVREVPVSAAP